MKSLRNLLLAIPLVTLVGCGCNEDDGLLIPFTPERQVNPFRVGATVPPIPVRAAQAGPKRIDIFFLMDDSGIQAIAAQRGMVYGQFALETPDVTTRKKQATAIAIFNNLVANIKADLLAQFPTETFDIAFGVGRYEDFGGSFRPGDAQARPFLLDQPIFRQDRETFPQRLDNGFLRIAPGNGNDPTGLGDAQSVVEALFQVGSGAGFDGDGGGKDGSGVFGAPDTVTSPGTSGDVPAAAFTADGNDEDGQPAFRTPGGLLASGNLGGVGWRPDALRYVLTTSDIAAVSPFTAGQAIPATITSTDGAAGYPRDPKAIPSQAFAAVSGNAATQAAGRFGVIPAPVAPSGAATVQQSVNALNALNIEVLSLGTGRTVINPFKPNLPGALAPAIAAIPNPSSPDFSPFTWMSAYALLTGAERPWPPATPTGNLPLVYDLQTVAPLNQPITKDVREDLVYRVGQGLSTLPSGTSTPSTPEATFEITPAIAAGAGTPFQITSITPLDTDGAGTNIQIVGGKIRVTVQRYLSTDPAPHAPREFAFLVGLTLIDPNNLGPLSDTMPFSFTLVATTPANAGDTTNPAADARSGRAFYTAPAVDPANIVVTGSAVITTPTLGCVFVADQSGGGRSNSSGCP